jgi:hypothetical protein
MFSLFCRETKLPRKELSSKPTPICISQELKSFAERSMKPVRWMLKGEVLALWFISPTWRKSTTAHLKYIINYSIYRKSTCIATDSNNRICCCDFTDACIRGVSVSQKQSVLHFVNATPIDFFYPTIGRYSIFAQGNVKLV